MSPPRVLIIGCGVAGPVLALLLKKKGYQPVVLEKVKELGDAGASLMMMPNGSVMWIPVGLSKVVTESAPHLVELRDQSSTGTDIGMSEVPASFQSKYGQPACGIKRTALNLALKQALIAAGIEIHEGWKLKSIEEKGTSVIARPEEGPSMEGSLLVGCDGIKAISRALLLEKNRISREEVSYTGLIQIAGMSPTPPSLKSRPGLLNLYGPGAHFICYPVSPHTTSWAITLRDPTEAQETWRIFSPDEMVPQRDELIAQFGDWSSPVPELIQTVERIIKYGLYDRPDLEPKLWYSPSSGRSVLIGDAAHPTSPHLGQGANQALEDCYHLSRLLPSFELKQGTITPQELTRIFQEFANMRQPRTAALVKGARAQGELRVVDGDSVARQDRDDLLKRSWANQAAIEAKYDSLLREPYQID